MSEVRKFPIPGDLVNDFAQTERAIANYAAEVTNQSLVSIRIDDCESPFLGRIPVLLSDAFPTDDKPDLIQSADLQLFYDGEKKTYQPESAELMLDNGYQIVIHRMRSFRGQSLELSDGMYWVALMDPAKKLAVRGDQTYALPRTLIDDILEEAGIMLPKSDQETELREIAAILDCSHNWIGGVRHSVPLCGTETLTVNDRIRGKGVDDDGFADESSITRKLTLSVDESINPGDLPHTSWQIHTVTRGELDPLIIEDMQIVPLTFEEKIFMEDSDSVLWDRHPPRRIEHPSEAKPIPVCDVTLQILNEVIETAREANS